MSSNAAVEGSVNEQQMSGEQKISRVNDILHLQALKATYCEIVDACVNDGGKAAARLAELFTERCPGGLRNGPAQRAQRRHRVSGHCHRCKQ